MDQAVSTKEQELEVKFYVADLPALEARLKSLGATLVQPRTYEINLRFDTPEGDLTRSYQVLRLRKDTVARVTYKGPSRSQEGVRIRQEYEFTVSDFDAAHKLFLALGYKVALVYEKYRTVYKLAGVEITLDEMPYGDFTEIEGPDPGSIREANRQLGLDWGARIFESYTLLFQRLKDKMGLSFRDLSFDNFAALEVTPAMLNVRPAD